jgi:hypothetical protein
VLKMPKDKDKKKRKMKAREVVKEPENLDDK